MLIGKQTPLNDTLLEALKIFMPNARLVSPRSFLAPDFMTGHSSAVVFVNITDLTNEESDILTKLRTQFPGVKIVGMHTFMVPQMKDQILNRGFDAYLSFFDFSDDIEEVLESFGVYS